MGRKVSPNLDVAAAGAEEARELFTVETGRQKLLLRPSAPLGGAAAASRARTRPQEAKMSRSEDGHSPFPPHSNIDFRSFGQCGGGSGNTENVTIP